MNTFYLVLGVVPRPENPHANKVEGALASCWVCDDDPAAALTMASFKVRQQLWEIVNVEDPPIKVTDEDYLHKKIGLERYKLAQVQGISMVFAAWPKDGKSSCGPIELKNADDFIRSEYLSEIGALKRKGRCLHFDAGTDALSQLKRTRFRRTGPYPSSRKAERFM
jgi:hypothetical protein